MTRDLFYKFLLIISVSFLSANAIADRDHSHDHDHDHGHDHDHDRGNFVWFQQPQQEVIVTDPTIDPVTAMAVQEALIGLGFYNGVVDGHVGPSTTTALVEFQRSANLTPTGIIDEATLNVLRLNGTPAND